MDWAGRLDNGNACVWKSQSSDQVENFIDESILAAMPRRETIGLGTEVEISGEELVGAALLHSGQVCHFASFAQC